MDRHVLEKFPMSHNRPSFITSPRFDLPELSMPINRWNLGKAKWSHYIVLTNKFAKTLLPPDLLDVDAAYQDFCNIINKAPKRPSHAVIETTTVASKERGHNVKNTVILKVRFVKPLNLSTKEIYICIPCNI